MRIAVVGRGVIGTAVADLLAQEHEVLRASRSGGDLTVDARSVDSIREFYRRLGRFDAVVMALGTGRIFTPFWEVEPEDYLEAWRDRVMTQANMVRLGIDNVNDGGVFVLSSGFMNKSPIPGFSAITSSNGGIDGFITGAAKDMPRGVRINGVSATFVKETLEGLLDDLSGFDVMPAAEVALAYRAAVLSNENGRDFDTRNYRAVRA
jgi:NAD(P)-dependent dehydrogenase (short-subunit alcohol dehydrogenase family)